MQRVHFAFSSKHYVYNSFVFGLVWFGLVSFWLTLKLALQQSSIKSSSNDVSIVGHVHLHHRRRIAFSSIWVQLHMSTPHKQSVCLWSLTQNVKPYENWSLIQLDTMALFSSCYYLSIEWLTCTICKHFSSLLKLKLKSHHNCVGWLSCSFHCRLRYTVSCCWARRKFACSFR